ncbi:MAG: response regulator [Anaerolineae bacterium]
MEKPFALIVEDDRDIAALFRHVLDIAGYRTEMAMTGRDAVDRLKLGKPDIVLLDLNLPIIPGAKILEIMKAEERLRDVPVIVVTGQVQMADDLAVEPDLVLLKPVNLSQLNTLVQRLRKTPGSMREAPWDTTTHLYNKSFFDVRLSYSLERARQIKTNRFGVMFIDLVPFAALRGYLPPDQLDIFLREVAGHLKTNLRPTDTVSRYGDGLYLVLIEDIPDYSIPASIAARLDLDLGNFIVHKRLMPQLRANVGMILCTADYSSVNEILGDIGIARSLFGSGQSRVNYERNMLVPLRGK